MTNKSKLLILRNEYKEVSGDSPLVNGRPTLRYIDWIDGLIVERLGVLFR